MAFSNAQNLTLQDCSFTDIQGDSNTYNVSGQLTINNSDAGLAELLKEISPDASYDAGERNPPPRCYPGTRTTVLQDVMDWVDVGPHEACGRVLWLHGPAGVGKSAIAQTICELCAERGDLAASFFFSRGRPGRDTHVKLWTTITFQLAMSIPGYRAIVRDLIDKDPVIIHRSYSTQIQKLIVEPLQTRARTAHRAPSLIVIDALDECKINMMQGSILYEILHIVSAHSVPLRFLVVSRPEPHLYHHFHHTELQNFVYSMSLYRDRQSREDVHTYLLSEFERIYSSERHSAAFFDSPPPFPSLRDLELLVDHSDGYFIYASTIVRYVDEEYFSPLERLSTILDTSSSGSGPFSDLDDLYRQVLSTSPNINLLKKILGFIVSPRDKVGGSLPGWFILEALHLQRSQLLLTLRGLHSILSDDLSHDIFFPFHESLREFLFDPKRAGKFYIDPRSNHAMIARGYLDCLKAWRRSPPPNRLAEEVMNDFLYHFSETQTHDAYTIQNLIDTDIHFWDVHAWAPVALPIYLRMAPDARVINWLSQARAASRTLNPPSLALTQHISNLFDTAVMYLFVWASAFKGDPRNEIKLVNLSVCFEDEHYIRRDQMPDLKKGGSIPTTHALLAWHCMRILDFPPEDVKVVGYWKERYNYARVMWAGHVSRAPPGDAELLFQLRHVNVQVLSKAPPFLEIPEEFSDDESDHEPNPSLPGTISNSIIDSRDDSSHSVSRVLDIFDSHGRHEKPVDLKIFLRQYQRNDCISAELILEWLKKMHEPPEDIVSCWETYRDRYREALDGGDDSRGMEATKITDSEGRHAIDELTDSMGDSSTLSIDFVPLNIH